MKVGVYLVVFQAVLIRFICSQTHDLREVVGNLSDGEEVKEYGLVNFASLTTRGLEKSISIWPWSVNTSYQHVFIYPVSEIT